MAKLYITEFVKNAKEWAGRGEAIAAAQADDDPAYVEQTPVAIGVGSVQSSAFNGATRLIRVHTDVICSIAIGANPTATADTMRMAAGQTEYFGVKPGHKIAVIQNT